MLNSLMYFVSDFGPLLLLVAMIVLFLRWYYRRVPTSLYNQLKSLRPGDVINVGQDNSIFWATVLVNRPKQKKIVIAFDLTDGDREELLLRYWSGEFRDYEMLNADDYESIAAIEDDSPEEQLRKAIAQEDFEEAARLRDMIKRPNRK